MATEVGVQEIPEGTSRRQIITDLVSGITRAVATLEPFTDFLLRTPFPQFLPVGVGRVVFGATPSNEARERDFSDLLLANLQKADEERERIQERLGITSKENLPVEEAARAAKALAIIQAAPVEASRKEVKLETEEQQLVAQRILDPLIADLKAATAEATRALAERRRIETATLLDIAGAQRELAVQEAALAGAKARAQEIPARIFDLATGGLDFFSKQLFARELLRVQTGQRPFFAPTERRRRVVTAF